MACSVSAALVHHPARSIDRLLARLGSAPVVVCEDQEPENTDMWPNAERAWFEGIYSGADYHVVMENDILVCEDFWATVLKAIDSLNGVEIMKFYSPQEIMAEAIPYERARDLGKRWAQLFTWYGAQAIAMRTDKIGEFLEWQRGQNYPDARLLEWTNKHEIKMWTSIPCLVEHDKVPSLAGLGYHSANGFIGENVSGLDIEW